MSLNAAERPSSGGNFNTEPLEAGTYPARIIGISNIGLHSQTYQGEAKDPIDNIGITYELLDEFLKDEDGNDLEDKPRWITEFMPFHHIKSERAKSTKRYLSVDPNLDFGGDWGQLLNSPIMLSVVQNAGKGKNQGKVFNNVDSISPMRPKEASKATPLKNPTFTFDFYDASIEDWNQAPGIVKTMVKKALNFAGSKMESWTVEDQEDEQPASTEKKVVKKVSNEEDW